MELCRLENSERDLLLGRIEEWRTKAARERDAFNRYVSLFTAYNVFYSLYEKTKNPAAKFRDLYGAISTLDLITDRSLLFKEVRPDLEDYVRIIPVYREEFWPPTQKGMEKVPIASSLKRALEEENADQAVEMLIKWLYRVRCNLVHGGKDFNDEGQKELLAKSSILLDKYMLHALKGYRDKYGGDAIHQNSVVWTIESNRLSNRGSET